MARLDDTEDTTGSTARALRVLITLGELGDGSTLTELAHINGCSIATMSRQMALLVKYGFARIDPETRAYSLGLRLFELGRSMRLEQALRQVSGDVLELLANESSCLASLDALENDEVVTIDVRETAMPIQVRLPVGFRANAFKTASGRAALSLLNDAEIERVCKRASQSDRMGLLSTQPDFETIRRNGWASNCQVTEPLIRAIGVPIRQEGSSLRLAISIAAPAFLIDEAELIAQVPALRAAAVSIANQISGLREEA